MIVNDALRDLFHQYELIAAGVAIVYLLVSYKLLSRKED